MYNGDNDGDLMAIVRSCSRLIKGKEIAGTPPSTSDPLSYLPPSSPPPFSMGMEESLQTIFPDLFPTSQTMFGGLEDICMPFLHPLQPQPPQPHPQSHPLQQAGLFQTLLVAAGAVVPTTMLVSEPLQKQPPLKQTRKPQLFTRRKIEKKKVVTLSADIRVPNDNWAWRKYGQKPIKGSPYPRSYYRCSTCKSCPAKKMVDKSLWDPEMFAISYTGDHNHPLPTHRNCAAGTTRNKYSASSSGVKKEDNGEGTSSGLSHMTPLATSPSTEEEDGVEAMLDIEDMEIVGDDEVVFLGDAPLKTPVAADAEDPFLSQMWNNDSVFFDDNFGGAATGGGHGGAN